MLTPDQRDEFHRTGLLRLPRAVPAADTDAMRERLWRHLAVTRGISAERAQTWPQASPRRLQALRRTGAFAAMAGEPLRTALDDLLGTGGWREPRAWGQPLVTFPTRATPWRAPVASWHLDSTGPEHDLPGLTVFAHLAPVAMGGGGTAVLAGSHRLVNRCIAATGGWRSTEVKAALAAEHPALGAVWTTGDEVDEPAPGVRLVELTGAAGDVVLMHPRTLHAPATNAGDVPRETLVEIVLRR